MIRPASVVLSAALLLAAAATAADEPAMRLPGQGVRAAVQVTVMDLDVVATAGGRPVTDLRKDEFTVEVDGKAIPLDYFAFISAGAVHGPDLATASPDLILETTKDDAGARFVPRQFLVFFDLVHLLPDQRSRMTENLRDLVTRLTPSDRMSIVAYTGASRVVVPFTSSKEDLLAALGKVEKMAPPGLRWESDYKREVLEIRRTRARSRGGMINAFGEQLLSREKALLSDLRRALAALAARSGKRVFLYASAGFVVHPGQILQSALGSPHAQFDRSVARELAEVVAEANRSGVTIHAIDARGLTTDVDASESSPSPFSYFEVNRLLQEGLASMAQETGGLLVANRNSFPAAMDEIYRDASSYYSVGVTLTSLDAKKESHKVRVTVSRPGVTVRARRSYGAKSSEEAARDRMEMALLTPDAGGDFPATIVVGTPKKGGGLGHRLAPFKVSVPIAELTFVDAGGKKKADVDVTLAAVEDDGARSTPVTERKTLVVEPDRLDAARKETFTYTGEVKTGTGNLRFVATVRDVASDRVAVTSTSVRVE